MKNKKVTVHRKNLAVIFQQRSAEKESVRCSREAETRVRPDALSSDALNNSLVSTTSGTPKASATIATLTFQNM